MIKNFIYLDEDKMYSLSSQIFEGITEYVLNENSSGNKKSETQKGPVGSGRVLADVIISSSKATEKKFFHDYSFTLFENHLIEQGRVLDLTNSALSLDDLKASITDFSFIKIKAKSTFNDVNKITELFSEFNTIGEALAHIGAFERINKLNAELALLKQQTSDRNKKSLLEAEHKKLTNLKTLAKESNLYQDQKFLDNLGLLTKYGFSDQFEINQSIGEVFFTSCLKRDFLRESEDILVKKYSRKTEKEVVIFGIISQAFSGDEVELDGEGKYYSNMKAALLNLVDHLSNIENSISGKQENEVVIDPIAAYFEV
ncbi:DUF6414 family protein [Vibrio cidicii]|uniref:DUF6414 family protein n=1 Tax=Vibrio TaxID=662 RepID=UPI0018696E8B|nr:hypothetical protein [Vibrio navarrensis]EJK2114084.1 hypothetical protein [Vibrio navarrensis]MBE4587141.1 hypothetical protein [Vibrio navarrensis]